MLAGLGLYEYVLWLKPEVAFYLAPTRGWELLTGALCSRIRIMPSLPRSTWLSTGGLIAILLAIFVLPAAAPYPSLCEIMAVLGAALIIVFSAEKGIAGWLLSSAPARFLGLISYSAYFWHFFVLGGSLCHFCRRGVTPGFLADSGAAKRQPPSFLVLKTVPRTVFSPAKMKKAPKTGPIFAGDRTLIEPNCRGNAQNFRA